MVLFCVFKKSEARMLLCKLKKHEGEGMLSSLNNYQLFSLNGSKVPLSKTINHNCSIRIVDLLLDVVNDCVKKLCLLFFFGGGLITSNIFFL